MHHGHNLNQNKERNHQHGTPIGHHSQHNVVLPKLHPKEPLDHHTHRNPVTKDETESLYRLFKDQNTVDILRHKNINEFKHKSQHENREDFEAMMREIEQQKDDIMKQMKIWTRILECGSKGEVNFSQNDYFQLRNAFYKWLLFIEQSYSSYQKIENSLPPPLIHQSPNNIYSRHHYNEEMVRKSHVNTKTDKQIHEKEIRRLNLMITDLQAQLDIKKIKLSSNQLKIQSMALKIAQLQERQTKNELSWKAFGKKIISVIIESEQFLKELQKQVSEGKDLKPYIQIIKGKLHSLKQYRESIK